MLRKESAQKDFFDIYVYERLLPKKHILLDIKEKVDFSFIGEEVKPFYSDDTRGRPPFPAEAIFKMLFLEFFYSLSDYEAVDQVKTNILFRYFVGLGISQDTPDDTTLVKFRNRLGEAGFKRLFDRIVEEARQKGLIKGKLKILDATHIQADIALQGAVNFLRQGRKVIVGKISQHSVQEGATLKEKYVNNEKLHTPPTDGQIKEELEITREFIGEVKAKFKQEAGELIDLLEEAVGQQKRKIDSTEHKEPEQIVSFTDTDARFGCKSDKKRFIGYKAHVSMDDESGIITSARTITGNRNEGANQEVKNILKEDASKNITHEAVCADSLYDSYENRQQIHIENMRAFIPSRTKTGKIKTHIENFIYDKAKDTLICPQGYSPISKTIQQQGTLYIFSTAQCKNCPNIHNCPTPNYERVRVFVSNDYRLKLMDDIPAKLETYVRRKGIERKFGEVKKWHGLSRARYRQRWRVAIQSFMTFSVVNIKRIVALLSPMPEYAIGNVEFG
ncbi:MAG: IS1182 family transposase [Nitrospirae bacterium]|nr:IS1182 family transposase [Nitrospirota bacterium]